jgi:hypothetical protein
MNYGPTLRGRPTCESSKSIDVRRWHRDGRLSAGQGFSWSWSCGGEPSGNISVRTESGAVVLLYRWRNYGDAEWKSVEQRVPITWTPCHLGGRRPWFICSVSSGGRYCGRRVALLYGPGELFACRRCYGWHMAASVKHCANAASLKLRKYERGWEAAQRCWKHSQRSQKGCTGRPIIGYAALTIALNIVQTSV